MQIRSLLFASVALFWLAAGLAASPAGASGSAPDPSTLGPFDVGHTQMDVVDPDREDRTLPTEIWYPADPGSAASLVVAKLRAIEHHETRVATL